MQAPFRFPRFVILGGFGLGAALALFVTFLRLIKAFQGEDDAGGTCSMTFYSMLLGPDQGISGCILKQHAKSVVPSSIWSFRISYAQSDAQ